MQISSIKRLATRACVLAFITALACAFAMTGCSQSSNSQNGAGAETVTFTDDLGNEVTVTAKPQRVVAGMGSFADTWQLAGGTLVGAPDEAFDEYGIDKGSVQSIGAFASISKEAILELDPDFVILTGNTTGQAGAASQLDFAQALESAGIPVAYFKVTTFDEYLSMLERLCQVTGRTDLYETNGTQVKAQIDKAIEAYSPHASGKTYLLGVTYSQGVRAQRSTSQTGAMLTDLGAVNIAEENESLLSDFSVESLLEIDPDYIFLVPMGNDEAAAQASLEALTSNEAWGSLSAARDGRVIQLQSNLYLSKPDAQWGEAYENLGESFR